MSGRVYFYLLILILLVLIMRPVGFWRQLKLLWARGNYVMSVLATAITIYLVYGLWLLYQSGRLPW